ncbi:MAG: alginate lyase family protein [Gemmatimonadetes bacterium]|nr:alginate lyase family protein [Gemmatimonadota bacterium]
MRAMLLRAALALTLLAHAAHAQAPALAPAAAREAAPRLLVLRGDLLASTRARVRGGDPSLKPAVDALVHDADRALREGPFTVTAKKRVPASGDRHDYMSVGPYWWPDPSRPNGLPYVRRDGQRNPETTNDYDSPRQAAMVDAVETLALAGYLTGNAAYTDRAAYLLRVWYLDPATRMNPNLRFGQAVPGRTEGRGTGIIDTHRLVRLADALGLLAASGRWPAAEQQGVRDWMRAYLGWLRDSKIGRDEQRSANNHGSWYDAQVAALALYVGDTATARSTLERAKTLRIVRQIRPDGRQPLELARTRSLHYSVFNLDALMDLAEMGRKVGVDLWGYRSPQGGSIRGALDYVAPYADPAKKWPGQEITTIEPDLLLEPLRRARAAYGGDAYAAPLARIPASAVSASRVQLLYPEVTRP